MIDHAVKFKRKSSLQFTKFIRVFVGILCEFIYMFQDEIGMFHIPGVKLQMLINGFLCYSFESGDIKFCFYEGFHIDYFLLLYHSKNFIKILELFYQDFISVMYTSKE